MARPTHRVKPSKNGGWEVVKDGTKRASTTAKTKQEAIDKGRIISRNQKTEFVIHKKNMRIQKADSHGNDPHPPKG